MPVTTQLDDKLGRIHAGDCVAGMRGLPDQCIDLVFADPPFNIGYDYDVYEDSLESDEYLQWCESWIREVHRVSAADGAFWLAIGDEYAAELKVLAQRLGFVCRSWVIWYYTFGVHCKLKFTRSHAHLFHFVKDTRHFKFNANDPNVRVPSARQLVYNDRRANAKGRMPDDTWILRPQDCPTGFTTNEDVWYFPRVAGTFKERAGFHGCQMPEQLLGRIIRACSNEGDVVMDPFSGSATTVAVAKKLGRQFLSFDMSDEYVTLGTDRLERIDVGDPLDGAADPLRSVRTTEQAQDRKAQVVAARRRATQSSQLQLTLQLDDGDDDRETVDPLILHAYNAVHDGHSLDRVLLDPVLRNRLHRACRDHDVTWPISEIGRRLIQLRAMGDLKSADADVTQPTILDSAIVRRYVHAAEIGWRALNDRVPGWSLESCFLEDDLAERFDRAAGLHASRIDSFDLRWMAVQLRDWAKTARHRAPESAWSGSAWTDPIAIGLEYDEQKLTQIASGLPPRGLVRLVTEDDRTLFVGGSTDTSMRLRDHFVDSATRDHWRTLAGGDPHVSVAEVPLDVSLWDAQCVWLRNSPQSSCNCLDLWLPASEAS